MDRKIDAETPPSLLLRIRDHDDDAAWATFVDVYSPLLYGFCRLRSLQAPDAADVTQEVLLRVAKAIQNFDYDPRKGLFRDWLATIVHNEIRRHQTKRRDVGSNGKQVTEFEPQGAQDGSSWEEHFHQHIFEVALERCKEHFTSQTWQLFERSWVQKEPVPSLAVEMGVGVDLVYVARSRVLKRLKYEVAILADDLI